MARRIEVELTSARDDGTWTWRAAGARQPKGTLDGGLLYEGAKVGDVVRADAEFEIDGITVVAVQPPKDGKRSAPERLEVVGSGDEPAGVTTSLVSPGERPRGDRGDRGRREGRREGAPGGDDRRGRPAGGGDRPRQGARPDRGRSPSARGGDRGSDRSADRGERPARGEGRDRRERPPRPEPTPSRPAPKRLQPGRAHRDAALAGLSPAERPIAEQVLKGGIPAVRKAIEDESARAAAEGRPGVPADTLLGLAEQLLPRLRLAEWLDRAEAAAHDLDHVSLRDLRAVVAGADDVARDDISRSLATTLRSALERRAEQERDAWLAEVRAALDGNRVVRALRISSRPPDVGLAFPADLAERLTAAAGAALAPDASADRWAAVLDALAWSPVRATVEPAGVPAEVDDALRQAVTKQAARLPKVAAAFGVQAPSPAAAGARGRGGPAGRRGRKPSSSPPKPGVPSARRRVPPPPPPGERATPPTEQTAEPEPEAAPAAVPVGEPPTPHAARPPEGDSFGDAVAAATLALGANDASPESDAGTEGMSEAR